MIINQELKKLLNLRTDAEAIMFAKDTRDCIEVINTSKHASHSRMLEDGADLDAEVGVFKSCLHGIRILETLSQNMWETEAIVNDFAKTVNQDVVADIKAERAAQEEARGPITEPTEEERAYVRGQVNTLLYRDKAHEDSN